MLRSTLILRAMALACGIIAWAAAASAASAQDIYGAPQDAHGLSLPVGGFLPGHTWVSYTLFDHAFGHEDTYYTAGTVQGLHTDSLGGWWFFDARAHVTDRGNYFSNFGLGRRIHWRQTKTDLGLAVYWDYDADTPEPYGFKYHQIGVTGDIRNELFDIVINGYIPFGDNQNVQDPFCFTGNRILLDPARDIALTGLDAVVSVRPSHLRQINGRIDVGGYYYRSYLVDGFGGLRLGMGAAIAETMQLDLQANFDDRFNTTALMQLSWHFGGHQSFSPTQRGLEPVRRNPWIARRTNDALYARNPATGSLWNAIHVDNALAAPGDGTYEMPFNDMTTAIAASRANDLILVRQGNAPYGVSVPLKQGQYFLGAGIDHAIPVIGRNDPYPLCDVGGGTPTLTNPAGGLGVVTLLGDDIVVSGFIIDAANNGFGVTGTNADHAVIDRNIIGNSVTAGIGLTGAAGSTITDNTITNPGQNAIRLVNVSETTTVSGNNTDGGAAAAIFVSGGTDNLVIDGNTINVPLGDGVLLDNLTGAAAVTNNVINQPGLSGIASTNTMATLTVTGNTIDEPGDDGIAVFGPAPDSTVSGNVITGVTDFGDMGIRIDGAVGDWSILGNTVEHDTTNPGERGVLVINSTADFTVDGNNLESAFRDGITFITWTGEATLTNNVATENLDDGISFFDVRDSIITMMNNTLDNNAANGVRIDLSDNVVVTSVDDTMTNNANGFFWWNSTGSLNVRRATMTGNALNGALVDVDGVAGDEARITIRESTITNNGEGIVIRATGPAGVAGGPRITSSIRDNISISENDDGGVVLETQLGATQVATISNNTISNNGQVAATRGFGIGVFSDSDPAGADGTSTAEVTILRNTLNDNQGDATSATAGMYFNTAGDAVLTANLVANDIDGTGAATAGSTDAVHFDFANTVTDINTVTMTGNNIANITDTGLVLNVGVTGDPLTDNARVDFAANLNDISFANVGVRTQTQAGSVTQFSFTNGSVTDSVTNNMELDTADASRLIALVQDNDLNMATEIGLAAASNGTSVMVLDFFDNTANTNTLEAATFNVFDTSTMFVLARNNSLQFNLGNAAGPPPVINGPEFVAQVDAAAVAGARMCVEATGNVSTAPLAFINDSATATYDLEYNLNTAPLAPITTGNINEIGVDCEGDSNVFRTFP